MNIQELNTVYNTDVHYKQYRTHFKQNYALKISVKILLKYSFPVDFHLLRDYFIQRFIEWEKREPTNKFFTSNLLIFKKILNKLCKGIYFLFN